MFRPFAGRFWSDARHYQIAALSTLVVFNLGWIDFGARPVNTALALAAALLTQIACARLTGVPIDLRSPLITGLSLSLLLRADEPWIHALAGVMLCEAASCAVTPESRPPARSACPKSRRVQSVIPSP